MLSHRAHIRCDINYIFACSAADIPRSCYTKVMKTFTDNHASILVLERGEEVLAALEQYALQYALESAWLSGLGAAQSVTVAWYDIETKQYFDRTFSEPLEILLLTGNFSRVDDKPFWHIHGTFAGSDYNALGGHVKTLVVGVTCELHITPLGITMTRRHDSTTGLSLLHPSKG